MVAGACGRRKGADEGYRFSRRSARSVVRCMLLFGALGAVGCDPREHHAESELGPLFPLSLDSLIALDTATGARFSRAESVPVRPVRSSIFGFGTPDTAALRTRLWSEIERELEAIPEPARLHATGIHQALAGDLDAAILCLGAAAYREPGRTDLWNDLAAVHLLRHGNGGGVRDLFDAHRASRRALSIEPTHAAAAFNLAEAWTRLSLVREGVTAWDRFLELEPEGEWAERGRSRRGTLTVLPETERWEHAKRTVLAEWRRWGRVPSDTVSEFPQRFREWALKVVLPAWARAWDRGDTRLADERLGLARSLGERLADSTEDHLVADSVAGIERAVREGDPAALDQLGTAVSSLARGLASFERQQYAAMRRDLALAESTFRPLDNPLWGVAAYYREAVTSHADPARTIGGLLEIVRSLQIDRYPQLRGYCELMIGSVEAATGDAERGIEKFDLARRLLDRSAPDAAGRIVGPFEGDALRLLGRNDEALTVYAESVARSAHSGHPRHYGVALYTLAELLIEEGDGEAALPIAEEMVANAPGHELPSLRAEARLQRGRARYATGLADAAAADLTEAEQWAAGIEDDDHRARIASAIDLAIAQVGSTQDPQDALRRLNRLLEARLERGYLYRLPLVLLERSRAYGALGHDDLREGDLKAALAEADRLSEEATQPSYRRSAFAQAREIVDEMVAFQLDHRNDPEAAFGYAELGRARELSQALGRRSGSGEEETLRPYPPDEVRSRLPDNTVLMEYRVLRDRLLVWTLDRGGHDFRVLRIDRAEALERVRAFRGALDRRAGSASIRAAAAELHDLLLKDHLPMIPPDSALVIVPDRDLSGFPFGALYDRTTGRFLIEDRPVVVMPSAKAYAAIAERTGRSTSTPASVLAVGDPRVSPKRRLRLQTLPRAADEARRVGSAFPAAAVLTGPRATKAAVLGELSRHPVVYIAAHASVDPGVPEHSALVLTGSDEEEGLLTAREIRELDLRGVRLVVLPVCEAVQGGDHGEEGLTGLVAAFLEAGVSTVVAPTRPVSDDGTAWLLDLVRSVAEGDEVGSAFRRAQASAIGTLHESEWSTFQLIGATGKEP